MKKIYSLFILSILALTMFVGCQMNPEDVKDVLNATYRVEITDNGYEVSVDKATPKADDTVVITITVPADFSADDLKLSVMKGTKTITFTDEESTETNKVKKSFIMPESDVVVTVNFEKKATQTDDTDNNDDTQIEPPTEGEDDNSDGEEVEEPVDNTPTVADFVDATDYDVYKDGNFLAKIKGKILNTICKNEGFVKDTDYTIEGNKVTVITGSRLYDWLPPQNLGGLVSDDEGGNGNGESGTETTSDTYNVFHINDNGNYVLDATNLKSSYAVGETVTLPIKTLNYTAPTGLYLVKTYVTYADKNAVAVTYNKDHTVSFKMPDSNVTVRADFYDVSFKNTYDKKSPGRLTVCTNEATDKLFDVGICFTEKVFDNLEYIDGKYVLRVANKSEIITKIKWENENDKGYWYRCIIETSYTEPKLCAIAEAKVIYPEDNQINL